MRARGHHPRLLISEKKVDSEASEKYRHLEFVKMQAVAKPATLSPKMIPFLWKLWRSVVACKRLLREADADAVIGMGGFTSLPPVLAGHRMGLKTFVHDSNARPGRANVLTSRFCTSVFLGLEAAKAFFPNRKTLITGTPMRPEMEQLPSRELAAAHFGLDPSRLTIVITGGSQGARKLNELAAQAAAFLDPAIQVLHIAGASDAPRMLELGRARNGYQVLGFCDQMALAYALADLIIARSGASSLTEIAHVGLPSILVPYPYAADDHQTRNAEVFAAAGAAKLIQERDLSPELLAHLAQSIMQDLPTSQRMAKAARGLAIPDAAERVCDAIEATLQPS